MVTITYRGLVLRYGEPAAYDILLRAERFAKSDYIPLDEESRLARAFAILNNDALTANNDYR